MENVMKENSKNKSRKSVDMLKKMRKKWWKLDYIEVSKEYVINQLSLIKCKKKIIIVSLIQSWGTYIESKN